MSAVGQASGHASLMDAVYRHQRHIYDLTRKYYLLGRDRLLRGLDVPTDGTVLELGCGTGRNIVLAARLYPDARFFGLDISAAMLETAAAGLAREALAGRAKLAQGDATDFDALALFGRNRFDRVFISYALSMIPGWEAAIDRALQSLAPGGSLHIVDFGQQERLPRWFGSLLQGLARKVSRLAARRTSCRTGKAGKVGRHEPRVRAAVPRLCGARVVRRPFLLPVHGEKVAGGRMRGSASIKSVARWLAVTFVFARLFEVGAAPHPPFGHLLPVPSTSSGRGEGRASYSTAFASAETSPCGL